MRYKKVPELLRIGVNEEVKLRQDCQPNIIWPENQRTMVRIASDYGMDKAIAISDDSIIFFGRVLEGGLKNYAAFFRLISASFA